MDDPMQSNLFQICAHLLLVSFLAYNQHHMIRVNSGMKQDAKLLKFLHSFNGTCQFPDHLWSSDNDFEFFADNA